MDLRTLKIDLERGVVEGTIVDHRGPEPFRLDGEAAQRVIAASQQAARAAMTELRPRTEDPAGSPSDAGFWDALYRQRGDGWELGRASPPLARYFEAHPPAGLRALVVGCGRGHEARLLAGLGAKVVAIDFSPEAVAGARAIATPEGGELVYRQRDLFEVARDPERYDLVVEHCCYCAIEPRRRPEYVAAMADALAPGGAIIGLFYAHGRAGGPPFTVTMDEVRAGFEGRFLVEELVVAEGSIAARAGSEIFARLRKRDG